MIRRFLRELPHDPIPLLALLSVPLAAYGIASLFDNAVHWSNPEYLIFSIPGALLNGTHLKWEDLLRGFDPFLFDVVRPRFINYVLTIINVKLRLLSYDYFIPSANLSIGVLVHIVAAPILFFLLGRKFLLGRWTALLGTCLYATSVGFLSSAVIFVQPGKNLLQTLTLALFLCLATLHEKEQVRPFGEERRGIVVAVMIFNFVCISIDELCLVSALVGAALFYRLFRPETLSRHDVVRSIRALTLYFSPFLGFLFFVLIPAPLIGDVLGHGWCNYIGSFATQATDSEKVGFLPFLYSLTSTAMAASWLPHPFPEGMTPYALTVPPKQVLALGACLAVLGVLFAKQVAARRAERQRQLGLHERLMLATVVYFVLQALVQRIGLQVTGGYYYCSMMAIFLSLLVVSLFAGSGGERSRAVMSCILPVLMIIQMSNFFELNARWRRTHAESTRALLDIRHAYPNLVVTKDAPRSPEQSARMLDLWQRWKRGEKLDASLMQNWPVADGWFLLELDALDGRIFTDPKPQCGWHTKSWYGWWQ